MRVLLVATNTEVEPYPVAPLGMAVIAGALSSVGHEVRQHDSLAASGLPDALRMVLREFRPAVVGLSLRNIDNVDSLTVGSHWALSGVRDVVALVRSELDVPVIMGGPGFSLMPEEILSYTGADYGVVGEGEAATCELLAMLAHGQTPPRVMRGHTRMPGELIGAAMHDPAIFAHYLRESGVAGIQTKRGCPKTCSYCTYPALEGRSIRAREPGAVVDDILRMTAEHDVHELFFTDAVFNDHEGHWLLLAEEMVRRGVSVPWTGFFQPGELYRDELRLCVRAGLKAVELGTDAATDATLRGICKDFDFATAERVSNLCLSERIPCAHFVIFGGPGETAATITEGLHNMERLGDAVVCAFLGIRVYPGTALFRQAVREGSLPSDASCLQPSYYFSPDIDPAEAQERIALAFRGRRDRLFPPSKGQEQMAVMRRFGKRGILWDTLIRFPQQPRQEGASATVA